MVGNDSWQGWDLTFEHRDGGKTCFDSPCFKNKLTLRRNSSKFLKARHKNRNISALEAKAINQGLTFITWGNDTGFGKAGEGHWQNAGLVWQIRNTNAYLVTRLIQLSGWGVMLQLRYHCITWCGSKENNSVFLNHWPPMDEKKTGRWQHCQHWSNFQACVAIKKKRLFLIQ